MRIAISASGADLDAPASSIFGRCPVYIFVDTETMAYEPAENPAANAAGGAGIQAAQFVIGHGAQAVVSGNVGPNAFDVLQAANVPVYQLQGGTVRQAVQAFREGRLPVAGGPTAAEHAAAAKDRGPAVAARAEEIASLQEAARDLRSRLAAIVERLDRLEKRQ